MVVKYFVFNHQLHHTELSLLILTRRIPGVEEKCLSRAMLSPLALFEPGTIQMWFWCHLASGILKYNMSNCTRVKQLYF